MVLLNPGEAHELEQDSVSLEPTPHCLESGICAGETQSEKFAVRIFSRMLHGMGDFQARGVHLSRQQDNLVGQGEDFVLKLLEPGR